MGQGNTTQNVTSEGENIPATARFGIGPHLTPTTKRRKTRDGRVLTHLAQRTCVMCKNRACTLVCSTCRYEDMKGEVFLCSGSKTDCFLEHQKQEHGI